MSGGGTNQGSSSCPILCAHFRKPLSFPARRCWPRRRSGGGPAAAGELKLALPVACEIGRDCFVQNFFDHDPGPERRDYACGSLSYDGHTGTDFRVADIPAMTRGVTVVAAAGGTVKAVRDGMPDAGLAGMSRRSAEGEGGRQWRRDRSRRRLGNAVQPPVEGQYPRAAWTDGRGGDTAGADRDVGAGGVPPCRACRPARGEAIDPFTGSVG